MLSEGDEEVTFRRHFQPLDLIRRMSNLTNDDVPCPCIWNVCVDL